LIDDITLDKHYATICGYTHNDLEISFKKHLQGVDMVLDTFDVDCIELVLLLWQTGYLTIKEKISSPLGLSYRLAIPNREVQISLNSLFITYLTD